MGFNPQQLRPLPLNWVQKNRFFPKQISGKNEILVVYGDLEGLFRFGSSEYIAVTQMTISPLNRNLTCNQAESIANLAFGLDEPITQSGSFLPFSFLLNFGQLRSSSYPQ